MAMRAMNGRRVLGAASIGLGLLIAALAACGPGDLTGLTSGLRQSQTVDGGSSSSSGNTAPSCVLSGPPPVPATASNVGEGTELIFAADDLRIDGDTANTTASLPVPIGIDLDKSCTNCNAGVLLAGVTPSCKPFGAGTTPCDGDGGTDNVTAPLLGHLTGLIQALDPTILKKRISDGFFSVIFDMIAWNGNADDPNVIVSVRMSTGSEDGSGNRATPTFDGTDIWDIDPTSITDAASLIKSGARCGSGTCIAGALDFNGYVANNTLVAHFDKLNFSFSVAGDGLLSIPYVGLTLIADITKDPNGNAKINGELSGRWPADNVLAAAGAFGNSTSGSAGAASTLCTNDAVYSQFKLQVCQSADLAASPKDDGKGTTCGALSESIRFDAVKATLGVVRANTSQTVPCGTHTNDTCAATH